MSSGPYDCYKDSLQYRRTYEQDYYNEVHKNKLLEDKIKKLSTKIKKLNKELKEWKEKNLHS